MTTDFKYRLCLDKPDSVCWVYETKWAAEKLVALLRSGEEKKYLEPFRPETKEEARLKSDNAKLEREVKALLAEIKRRDAAARAISDVLRTLNKPKDTGIKICG